MKGTSPVSPGEVPFGRFGPRAISVCARRGASPYGRTT